MKFDREVIVGILICGVILLGWEPFARWMGWMPPKAPPAAVRTAPEQPAPAPAQPAPAPAQPAPTAQPAPAPPAPAPAKAEVPSPVAAPAGAALKPEPLQQLVNRDVVVTIDPNAGAVVGITLKQYRKTQPLETPSGFFTRAYHRGAENAAPVSFDFAPAAAALGLECAGWRTVALQIVPQGDRELTVTRRMVGPAGAEFNVRQKWSIGDNGFTVKYDVSILNSGKTALTLPKMEVGCGVLGSSQPVGGDTVRGDSHYLDYLTATGENVDVAADKKDEKFFAGGSPQVVWTALSNKYFCMILNAGERSFPLTRKRAGNLKDEKSIAIETGMLVSDGTRQLSPGAVENCSFSYYCGPKILQNLTEFKDSAAKIMHLSWGPLNYLARFMLWILVKLHALIGSYGVGIILLTLFVRLIFYPITARGNASMKKMQAVQPKIKELREKYKDNPQLMNTKMMELYRTEGINPFGGCLPILLQIPVFLALYSTFNGAVELRQSSFLWCHNLAAADTVAYIFSLPINPLVLIMTALMVLQQYMTPMSMDPAQKKMMLAMPVVMLFFFYDLPSGLTLYWTVSNVFSIIQLRLQQRGGKTTEAAEAAKN